MFGPILSILFNYVEFIINLFMVVALWFSWFLLLASWFGWYFFMNIVWMFKLYLYTLRLIRILAFCWCQRGREIGINQELTWVINLILRYAQIQKQRGRIYVSDRLGNSVRVFLDFRSCHNQKGRDCRSKASWWIKGDSKVFWW